LEIDFHPWRQSDSGAPVVTPLPLDDPVDGVDHSLS